MGQAYQMPSAKAKVGRERRDDDDDVSNPFFLAAIGAVAKSLGDETTELNPVYDYGKSKVLAEQALKEIAQTHNMPYVILRPTGNH